MGIDGENLGQAFHLDFFQVNDSLRDLPETGY